MSNYYTNGSQNQPPRPPQAPGRQPATQQPVTQQLPQAPAMRSLSERLANVDPLFEGYLGRPPIGRHLVQIVSMEHVVRVDENTGNRTEIFKAIVEVTESDQAPAGQQYEMAFFPPGKFDYELKRLSSLCKALGLHGEDIDRAFSEEQICSGARLVVEGKHAMWSKGPLKGQQRMDKNGEPIVNHFYKTADTWRGVE